MLRNYNTELQIQKEKNMATLKLNGYRKRFLVILVLEVKRKTGKLHLSY